MDARSIAKFLSLNLHGLAQPARTRRILTELAHSNYDVILLQETHLYTDEHTTLSKNIWRGKSIWDNGKLNSCGVAVLFRPGLVLEILKYHNSGNGQSIIVDCRINDEVCRIVNIYAPVKKGERNEFFKNLTDTLPSNHPIIMGGDFNFVENPALDIKGGSTGHGASSRPVFKTLTGTTNLVDNCRCFSPQGVEPTFILQPSP